MRPEPHKLHLDALQRRQLLRRAQFPRTGQRRNLGVRLFCVGAQTVRIGDDGAVY